MAKTTASSIKAQSIGTIKGLIGTATATDASGVVRTLHIGDKVYANEIIQTSAAGTVQIEFANANFATVGHGSSLALDKTVFDPNTKSGNDGDVAKAQAKIAAGADPTEVTDSSAAGPGSGGSDGEQGGHQAVFVQQNAASGNLLLSAEFETSSTAKLASASSLDSFVRVNTPPVAEPATAEAVEDGKVVSGNVVATDFDGDALTYSLVDEAPAGLIFNVDGSYSFDPKTLLAHETYDSMAEGEIKTITVNYLVEDGNGGTDTSTLTITIIGTNDLPVITSAIQSGSVTEAPDDIPVNAGGGDMPVAEKISAEITQNASGSITFSDVDTSDTHSATVTPKGEDYLGELTLGEVDQSGHAISWTFSVADSSLDFLGAGEHLTQTYTVDVADNHGGHATQDITISIYGTNDVPVITSETQSGSVTEIADGANGENVDILVTDGTITFTDLDLTDSHVVSYTTPDGSDYLGNLELTIDQNTHEVSWTFSVADSAVDALGANEVLTQTYTIAVNDGHGGTTTQDVTITITGTNDVPVLGNINVFHESFESGAFNANYGYGYGILNGSVTELSGDGAEWTTGSSGVEVQQFGIAPDGVHHIELDAATNVTLTTTVDTADHNTYTLSFDYSPRTDASDMSSCDMTVTFGGHTFTVDSDVNGNLVFTDGVGVSHTAVTNANGWTTITLTFTGIDAPKTDLVFQGTGASDGLGALVDNVTLSTIDGVTKGYITEIADLALNENASTLSDSGTIHFTDVDLTDVHSAGPVIASDGALGTLTATVTHDTTGSGIGGVITWNYSVEDSAIDHLAAGETKIETFTFNLNDGHGGLVSQTVQITLTGTNDVPTISAQATDSQVFESGLPSGTHVSDDILASGHFTIGDDDGSDDIHSVTITGDGDAITLTAVNGVFDLSGQDVTVNTAHGTATITGYDQDTGTFSYTYELTHATTDVDKVTETDSFVITVTDNAHTSANATVTIDINDDQPVLHVTQGVDQGMVPVTLAGELAHMGADVSPDVPGSHINWDSLPSGLTSNGVAVTYTGLGTDTVTGMAGDKAVFTLTGNPDGTYEYAQFSQLVHTSSTTFNHDLGNASAYYLYTDGSLSATNTTDDWSVMITGKSLVGNENINPTANGLAIDSLSENGLLSTKFNSLEIMRLDFNEGANQTTSVQIALNGLNDSLSYEKLSWTVHFTDGSSASGSIDQYADTNSFTITAPDGKYLDYVELMPNTGLFTWTEVTIGSITVQTAQDLSFGFTATDGDGDQVSGTLNIDGSLITTNDAPMLTVSGNIGVAESGLSSGTASAANTEHASGTFSVHDDQGLHDISTITLGGTSLAVGSGGLAGLIGTTVNTAHGTVEITGYNANANGTDGTFTYEYTLTGASNATKDSFGVAVSDGASASSATITVNIADDAPVAIHDAMSQTEASSVTYSGVNSLTYNDIFGADGTGTPSLFSASYGSQSHTFTSAADSYTFNLGTAGTATLYGDGHYTYNAANVANNVSVGISYVVKDGDGTHSSAATLTLSTSDRSEVSATNDTANVAEGYWQASTANTSYAETVTTQSWSAMTTNHSVSVSDSSIDPDWILGDDSISSNNFSITADASHAASITVQVDVNGYRNNNDEVEIRLYNGTTLVQTIDVTGNVNNNAYTFNVTSSGNYHVELYGHDGTAFNNLTAHIDSVSYTAYTATSTPHTISVAAPAAEWHAATSASGNVVSSNDSPGSEGAFITLISSSVASNVAVNAAGVNINGTYGTLHIEADGDYTYTPTAIDHPAGAVDSFTYTLAQADGDKATATLTVSLANHDYPTTGSEGVNDLLYGSASADTLYGLGGNDHLVGNGGNDTLHGGIGSDILEGGDNNDTLYGGAGSDALLGGNGADILVGGQGGDILTGGAGSDIFRYQSGDLTDAPYGDVIKDFTVNTVANGGDVLDVSDLLPTLTQAQLTTGGFLKFEYVSGDANTTVVKLSIDADGSSVGGSVYTPLATITLTGAGTINPTDILNKLLANGEIQY